MNTIKSSDEMKGNTDSHSKSKSGQPAAEQLQSGHEIHEISKGASVSPE
eukprot:CAMPEP_0201586120 /NCGR_PEP_ID=MMETSP0190_2-20130828/129334_1 /ASSEMBLY_ACC=CAM_ASM_000263 /TAXON_ID=37353 /ORGANISM="Rosalina sp." /LENGTH=48 /DNA_ID= /DNA_START= /DNA_END= /DNA_ORIENTATION=